MDDAAKLLLPVRDVDEADFFLVTVLANVRAAYPDGRKCQRELIDALSRVGAPSVVMNQLIHGRARPRAIKEPCRSCGGKGYHERFG